MNNVAFDFDVSSKDFTWDYKEMIEIKKKKRVVSRFYKPTARVLASLASAQNWQRAQIGLQAQMGTGPWRYWHVLAYALGGGVGGEPRPEVLRVHGTRSMGHRLGCSRSLGP